MDFLAAGIMLCLQRERMAKVVLLTLICILVQEGTGPLAFGASIMRYGALIGLYVLGRSLFDPNSPAFIILLAAAFTVAHFLSLKTIAGLQDLVLLDQRLLMNSIQLFFVFLAQWFMLSKIYQAIHPYASRS